MQIYSSSCAKWQHQDFANDEPHLYTRMVYFKSKPDKRNYSRLRIINRYHYRFLYRNGRRSSANIKPDGILQIRPCLHVFLFERPGTLAARRFKDDVPLEIKKRRLQEVVALHRNHSLKSMQKDVGKTFKVLIEGNSKKSEEELTAEATRIKWWCFRKEILRKEIM